VSEIDALIIDTLKAQHKTTQDQTQGAVLSFWMEGQMIASLHDLHSHDGAMKAISKKSGISESYCYHAAAVFRQYDSQSKFEAHMNSFETPTIGGIINSLPSKRNKLNGEHSVELNRIAKKPERTVKEIERFIVNADLGESEKRELAGACYESGKRLMAEAMVLDPDINITDADKAELSNALESLPLSQTFTEKETKWIEGFRRSRGCAITGPGPVDLAHFPISKGAGAPDCNVIGLSHELHLESHGGIQTFIGKYYKELFAHEMQMTNEFIVWYMSQAEE